MDLHLVMWIVFGAIIATVLALDLFVLHKNPHAVSLRESMMWSGIWIAIALAYGGALWLLGDYGFGPVLAKQYLAGYVIELALSVDNLFVFAIIFAALAVKREHQHKLLFWGVFGALVLRAIFIFAGVAIIEMFSWTMYIFGGILIVSAIKLLLQGEKEIDPKKSLVIRGVKKVFPVKPDIGGPTFWVKIDGKRYATMLFVGLILVEVTDVIFAIDSIPAVLAVAVGPDTVDPVTGESVPGKADTLVVYASNAFAIMGLRSLYFALAGIMAAFRFLKYGLVAILAFVGAKMVIGQGIPGVFEKYHFSIEVSLGVIGGVLALCVVLSLIVPRKLVDDHVETLIPNPPDESATPPAQADER